MEETQKQQIDFEALKLYARLSYIKKVLKNKAEKIGKKLAEMEEPLLEQLATAGIPRLPFDRYGTLHTTSQIWPAFLEGKGREDVVDAMKLDGLEDYVREDYNAISFAAFVRSALKENDGLPENIAKCVEPRERFKLVLRKK